MIRHICLKEGVWKPYLIYEITTRLDTRNLQIFAKRQPVISPKLTEEKGGSKILGDFKIDSDKQR